MHAEAFAGAAPKQLTVNWAGALARFGETIAKCADPVILGGACRANAAARSRHRVPFRDPKNPWMQRSARVNGRPPEHCRTITATASGSRRRFRAVGPEALSDYELLEAVLFCALPRRDVKPLAKTLIATFGSFAEVIAVPAARLAEAASLKGFRVDLRIVSFHAFPSEAHGLAVGRFSEAAK